MAKPMKCIHCKRPQSPQERAYLDDERLAYYARFGIPPETALHLCRKCLLKQWRRQIRKTFYKQPKYRISRNVANAIRKSIRTGREFPWWERQIGYTWAHLKKHLEKRFEPGMTWENYGQWHIDHIQPIASFEFDSCDSEAFKRCWAMTNLQPLWAAQNWDKH